MLAIPTIISIAVVLLSGKVYGDDCSVLLWSLVPMWLCYFCVAICDVYHIC